MAARKCRRVGLGVTWTFWRFSKSQSHQTKPSSRLLIQAIKFLSRLNTVRVSRTSISFGNLTALLTTQLDLVYSARQSTLYTTHSRVTNPQTSSLNTRLSSTCAVSYTAPSAPSLHRIAKQIQSLKRLPRVSRKADGNLAEVIQQPASGLGHTYLVPCTTARICRQDRQDRTASLAREGS